MKYTATKVITQRNLYLKQIAPNSLPNPSQQAKVFNYINEQKVDLWAVNAKGKELFKSWVIDCTPVIKKNISNNVYFSKAVLRYLSNLKLYRSEIIDQIVQKQLHALQIEKMPPNYIVYLYSYLVNMKVSLNPQTSHRIKARIINKITLLKNTEIIKFMSAIALDQQLPLSQKNKLLTFSNNLSQNCLDYFQNKCPKPLLSSFFEKIKLYNLNICPALYSITEKCNAQLDNQLEQQKAENQRRFHHKSTFQIIFARQLFHSGYIFKSNVSIKSNQYDFIVYGTGRQKYLPLKDFDLFEDLSQKPVIQLQKVRMLARNSKMDWINKNEYFEEVVIGLNGPTHFIDSDIDIDGSKRITREEEFTYEKLSLYGIKKYNTVSYNEWRQASKYQKRAEQFLKMKIQNAKSTTPIID